MSLARRDTDHVFQSLRTGVVPERGLEAFAVGIERPRAELRRLLELAKAGEGVSKFLRGGYGCGKTFMARLAVLEAQALNFATSFVVVSDNDLHLHRFDDVYRKVVQGLGTTSCPRGALSDVIDRWIARVEASLVAAGADENAADFDQQVQKRLGDEITSMTGGKAPEDLARVLRTIFALKQEGKVADAGALLSWLSGSENVAQTPKKRAELKGEIRGRDALAYLRGVLEIVKAAGYAGLVIVIDEVETILRMRKDVREKSLNGIRQILDASPSYPGLLWVFTGTPDFFDTRRGVAGLQPLHDRIRFLTQRGFASLSQPQLELKPFDKARLKEVALKLRELFPTELARGRLETKVTPAFLETLVDRVSAGLRGDVGVVPRQFLRELVEILDLVAEHEAFDPRDTKGFAPKEPSEDEKRVAEGRPAFDPEPDDEKGYAPVAVEL